ncbi:MAG: MarR family transcriptional regulator [Alphaproteobacteria bacterium]|nr:MAG: MarR family transcriptional regulator [Alphaproteobacteria bacterium]
MEDLFIADHTTDYLRVWKDALIDSVRSARPDLTNRHMAVLMIVYLEAGPHTVRGLARRIGVAKPVITRALNTLAAHGFVRRKTDMSDRRNLFVQRTVAGAVFLSEIGESIAARAGYYERVGTAGADSASAAA